MRNSLAKRVLRVPDPDLAYDEVVARDEMVDLACGITISTARLVTTNMRLIIIPTRVTLIPLPALPWSRPREISLESIERVTEGSRISSLIRVKFGRPIVISLRSGEELTLWSFQPKELTSALQTLLSSQNAA